MDGDELQCVYTNGVCRWRVIYLRSELINNSLLVKTVWDGVRPHVAFMTRGLGGQLGVWRQLCLGDVRWML